MIGVQRAAEIGDSQQHGHEKHEYNGVLDEAASAFPFQERKPSRRVNALISPHHWATRSVAVLLTVIEGIVRYPNNGCV